MKLQQNVIYSSTTPQPKDNTDLIDVIAKGLYNKHFFMSAYEQKVHTIELIDMVLTVVCVVNRSTCVSNDTIVFDGMDAVNDVCGSRWLT